MDYCLRCMRNVSANANREVESESEEYLEIWVNHFYDQDLAVSLAKAISDVKLVSRVYITPSGGGRVTTMQIRITKKTLGFSWKKTIFKVTNQIKATLKISDAMSEVLMATWT